MAGASILFLTRARPTNPLNTRHSSSARIVTIESSWYPSIADTSSRKCVAQLRRQLSVEPTRAAPNARAGHRQINDPDLTEPRRNLIAAEFGLALGFQPVGKLARRTLRHPALGV